MRFFIENGKIIILIAYLLVKAFTFVLRWLNLNHLKSKGKQVPPEFTGYIDSQLLTTTVEYTIEKTKFGFVESAFEVIIVVVFIFGGVVDHYSQWVEGLGYGFVLSGVVFFLPLYYVSTAISIPFSLYLNFRIENKYGFNTTTARVWITDRIISLIVSTILLLILISASCGIIKAFPQIWWLFVWGFVFMFSIFVTYISPYLIEPLFNKYTPAPEEIESMIKELMEKVRIRVSRVFVMDASKRSKHSNAYFSGIGRTKRIVLFDTLLGSMKPPEILSIIAHEAGHWKKKHLLKRVVFGQLVALVGIYLAFRVVSTDLLMMVFGYETSSFFASVLLFSFVASIVMFPTTPLISYLSRRQEMEADQFAVSSIGNPEDFCLALIKLSKDNLINLHPHPLFAKFYYSHPPVVERIRKIRAVE